MSNEDVERIDAEFIVERARLFLRPADDQFRDGLAEIYFMNEHYLDLIQAPS